ncbi:Ig-like domain-containing protein [Microbacterium sp. ARD31]|uniref:Ig-like domain-containing protein n=1 Tax=Microbacterium sp. ARD31 TaxID=2962576 RepID=UPI002882D121|nr:Ig-like domain-containing protein [Microbacterium sp. ARD31]MDT0184856.1 Ig-like domain-containing protein [Microbacterium sp. ARD31]
MIGTALRTLAIAAFIAVLGATGGGGSPKFSSAAFVTQSTNLDNRVTAAADWTPPTVSVQAPGSGLKDTVWITALASDAETGIKTVSIFAQPVGASTWTTLCTTTTEPYRCSWDTRTLADGTYDLRASATDNSNLTTTSSVVRTTIANAFAVLLADPGDAVRGSVALPVTLQNAGTGSYSVRVEYYANNKWNSLCVNMPAPYTCTWVTTSGFANDYYDLRAAATLGSVTTYSAVIPEVLVDNVAPTVTMTDPGTPLSGTITLAAAANDTHSGVATVTIQYAPSSSGVWTTACTVSATPFSCRFATTALTNGTYSFRAVATDAAGNTMTSSVVSNRFVDNTVTSISLEDPGAFLTGSVTLTANASSTAGIMSVAIQYAPAGTSAWTTACSITVSPYQCTWNTTSVGDGLYDLRAILTDGSGRQTTSTIVASRRVDNTPVRGLDVQTANGAGTAGRLDPGDTLTFIFSEQMAPASITQGWNGSAVPVTLRLRDGNLVGGGNAGDTVDIQRSGAAVNLGSVNLRGDYIRSNKTTVFNATMVSNVITVNGMPVTAVTVTVGTNVSGGSLRTVSTGGTMTWSPSASATDLAGNKNSTAPVNESGAIDREF